MCIWRRTLHACGHGRWHSLYLVHECPLIEAELHRIDSEREGSGSEAAPPEPDRGDLNGTSRKSSGRASHHQAGGTWPEGNGGVRRNSNGNNNSSSGTDNSNGGGSNDSSGNNNDNDNDSNAKANANAEPRSSLSPLTIPFSPWKCGPFPHNTYLVVWSGVCCGCRAAGRKERAEWLRGLEGRCVKDDSSEAWYAYWRWHDENQGERGDSIAGFGGGEG